MGRGDASDRRARHGGLSHVSGLEDGNGGPTEEQEMAEVVPTNQAGAIVPL